MRHRSRRATRSRKAHGGKRRNAYRKRTRRGGNPPSLGQIGKQTAMGQPPHGYDTRYQQQLREQQERDRQAAIAASK